MFLPVVGSPNATEEERNAHSPWVSVPARMAAFLTACYVAWCLLTPILPPLGPITGAFLSVTVTVVLSVGIIYHTARVRTNLKGELAGVAVCIGMWVVLVRVLRPMQDARPVATIASHMFFIFGATFLGKAATRAVRTANILLPIAVVAAVFDAVYVFWGPTGLVTQGAPEIVSHVSVPVLAVGGARAPGAAPPGYWVTLGPGDIIFIAFLLAACLRLNLNARGTYMAMTPLIIGGLCFVAATAWPLPGWLVIVPGFIAANCQHFRYTADEKRAMLQASIVVAILVGITIALFFLAR